MKKKIKLAIEEYQCLGCVVGCDISCFKINTTSGVGCGQHYAGTVAIGIGTFFLGIPKGFNRLGEYTKLKPNIYDTFESSEWSYDMLKIPVWKYLSKDGHTFVRGIMPRKNEPFIHIFLENCISKINCLEITPADVESMD
jgi:hypothetical protein